MTRPKLPRAPLAPPGKWHSHRLLPTPCEVREIAEGLQDYEDIANSYASDQADYYDECLCDACQEDDE